jgi:chorismate mutase
MKLRALRGAITVEENTTDAILDGTEELLRAILERNRLDSDNLVSCIFTTTDDLNAEFPAVAARNLGLNHVPLLCAQEIAVPGGMERVIRTMVHYYAPTGHEPAHVYLGAAAALRSDLGSAQ